MQFYSLLQLFVMIKSALFSALWDPRKVYTTNKNENLVASSSGLSLTL